MPAAGANPPHPRCADLCGHLVAELEAGRGDPQEALRVDAECPAGVIADNDKRRIFLHTAVKVFSCAGPCEVTLGVVRTHEAGGDVIAQDTPAAHEGR